jgi:hypothetical protein
MNRQNIINKNISLSYSNVIQIGVNIASASVMFKQFSIMTIFAKAMFKIPLSYMMLPLNQYS